MSKPFHMLTKSCRYMWVADEHVKKTPFWSISRLKVVYLQVRWVSKLTHRVTYASFDPWHLFSITYFKKRTWGVIYVKFVSTWIRFFAYYSQNKASHGLILSLKLLILSTTFYFGFFTHLGNFSNILPQIAWKLQQKKGGSSRQK